MTLALVAAWAAGWAPSIVALAALAIQGVVDWLLRARVRAADRAVTGHGPDLEMLAVGLIAEREDGLTAGITVLVSFTVYFATSLIIRPLERKSPRP